MVSAAGLRRFVSSGSAALLLVAGSAHAHDLGVDLSLNGTAPSATNPRSGSAAVALSGSYDFSEKWTGFFTAAYLRDFPTRTDDTSSPGSNIAFFSAGAMFLASDHLLLMATLSGSPPTVQRNATSYDYAGGSADVVIRGNNASAGGSLLGSWASNGLTRWEHTVDVSAGVNRFETEQTLELGSTLRARLFRTYCERNPATSYCPLVNGLRTPLTQVRVAAAYTATLFTKTDVALEVAGFVYDTADPSEVGSFSAVVLGRQGPDMGQGIPVAPWRLTLRPSVLHRFGKVSVRVAWQLGVYTGNAGVNHLVSARVSWKVSPTLRLSLSALGQADVDRGAVLHRGGTVSAGVVVVFP